MQKGVCTSVLITIWVPTTFSLSIFATSCRRQLVLKRLKWCRNNPPLTASIKQSFLQQLLPSTPMCQLQPRESSLSSLQNLQSSISKIQNSASQNSESLMQNAAARLYLYPLGSSGRPRSSSIQVTCRSKQDLSKINRSQKVRSVIRTFTCKRQVTPISLIVEQ